MGAPSAVGSAGVGLRITSNGALEAFDARLRRLQALDLSEMLESVGSVVESQTRRRITDEKTSPEGVPWAEWQESYAGHQHGRNKGHKAHPGQLSEAGGHSILELSGDLKDSIQFDVQGDSVIIGSNLIYARVHQEGFAEKNIPARPYLGLSDENRDEVEQMVRDFIEEALS